MDSVRVAFAEASKQQKNLTRFFTAMKIERGEAASFFDALDYQHRVNSVRFAFAEASKQQKTLTRFFTAMKIGLRGRLWASLFLLNP